MSESKDQAVFPEWRSFLGSSNSDLVKLLLTTAKKLKKLSTKPLKP